MYLMMYKYVSVNGIWGRWTYNVWYVSVNGNLGQWIQWLTCSSNIVYDMFRVFFSVLCSIWWSTCSKVTGVSGSSGRRADLIMYIFQWMVTGVSGFSGRSAVLIMYDMFQWMVTGVSGFSGRRAVLLVAEEQENAHVAVILRRPHLEEDSVRERINRLTTVTGKNVQVSSRFTDFTKYYHQYGLANTLGSCRNLQSCQSIYWSYCRVPARWGLQQTTLGPGQRQDTGSNIYTWLA